MRWGWVLPAVLHEKEKAHKGSVFTLLPFYHCPLPSESHMVGSVFICNITVVRRALTQHCAAPASLQ